MLSQSEKEQAIITQALNYDEWYSELSQEEQKKYEDEYYFLINDITSEYNYKYLFQFVDENWRVKF